MSQPAILTTDPGEKDDLYDWLNDFDFSKQKKNLARDFSDGVLLAELLKKHFPRLVELHNYVSANSVSNKLRNWTRLNNKVLKKIGIAQTEQILTKAANSNREAIEDILTSVKGKLEEIDRLKNASLEEEKNSIVDEYKMESSRIVEIHIPSTVPFEEHHSVLQELETKKEEIASLHAKISRLESLLELKDQRLSDLSFQIKRCECHK